MKSCKKTFQPRKALKDLVPRNTKDSKWNQLKKIFSKTHYSQTDQNHRQRQEIKIGKRETASSLQKISHQTNSRPLIGRNASKERMGKYIQSVMGKAISNKNTVPSKIILHMGRKDKNILR